MLMNTVNLRSSAKNFSTYAFATPSQNILECVQVYNSAVGGPCI